MINGKLINIIIIIIIIIIIMSHRQPY